MTGDAAADLRVLAERLATDAGDLALAGRRSDGVGQMSHDTKSTATDPVTEFDRAAEALLVERLRARRPDDAIVGEEGADTAGTSGIEWHLDPIDGTVNFVYDLPTWSTSVAAVDEHGPIAGAVYAPVLGELFSAHRDGGATLNGIPIRCSDTTSLDTTLVGTGFSYLAERRSVQAMRLAGLLTTVRDVRRFGSAAIDLCLVACGRLDAYYEEHLNSWDLAAGVLIAMEAGAQASDFRGGPVRPDEALVATPGIHAQLRDAIRAIDG